MDKLSSENYILNCFKSNFFEHYAPLCSYVTRFIKERAVAEDIVQDVFTSLWAKREEIDFSRPLKPLLYTYTRNKALDVLKSRSFNLRKLDDGAEHDALDEYVKRLMVNRLEEELDFRELDREIISCIDSLPEQCRTIYNMSRVSHLKNREIALTLGISEKSVERNISKALSEIRNHLVRTGLMPMLLVASILLKN